MIDTASLDKKFRDLMWIDHTYISHEIRDKLFEQLRVFIDRIVFVPPYRSIIGFDYMSVQTGFLS